MTYEEVKVKLHNQSYFLIMAEKETGNSCLTNLNNDSLINWFQMGKYSVQGKNSGKQKIYHVDRQSLRSCKQTLDMLLIWQEY